ncbi:MAG: TonB-dependent receptor [Acidobacteria bacterium]|nr:TonB-dependent receptor [Acidobacteriota bacterium]
MLRLRKGGAARPLALVLACLLGIAVSAAAQSVGGVITGTVKDAQGGVLPGVSVTLRNVDSGVVRSAVTEANGAYRLPGLPPGRYALSAELQGFANAEVSDLTITIGLELQRDLTMNLQGLQETLTVSAEAPVIETTQTQVAAVVTQEQIEMLPVANRMPISLALLLPGTSMNNLSGRRPTATIGAGGGNGGQMNLYYADGGMNMSNNSGQQHLEVPQSAVREFKVNISQSSAEFNAVGGVVQVATKSGTNRFSGEAFEFFRDKSLNAFDKFEKQLHDRDGEPKPDYRRHSVGVALGGPLIKDKLHFFAAIERAKEDERAIVETGQPQFYSKVEGTFPRSYMRRAWFARVDYQVNQQQTLFWRYVTDLEHIRCESCGGSNAANVGADVWSPRDSNLLAHTWVIGSRMLNEIRAQIPPSHLDNRNAPPGVGFWDPARKGEFPAERFAEYPRAIFQFPSLTWGSNALSMNWTDRQEYRDDFSWTLDGGHSLKFGGAYVRLYSPEEQGVNLGTWVFATDQFFDGSAASIAALRSPIQFTASFPPLPRKLENHWIQGYVADQWRVRPNVTVDLGVRYDNQYHSFNYHVGLAGRERLGQLINPRSRGDNNNVAPRFGVAWDVNSDGRSVVRAAYGWYYQYVMQNQLRPELTALLQSQVNIRNPSYPDPYNGLSPQAFVTVSATPNVNILDDNIENAEAKGLTVGYSQELRANMAVHVDGVYTNVDKMTQSANINTPNPTSRLRPIAGWGNIVQLRSAGFHDYRAMLVRLDKRFANRHQYMFSYTLGKETNQGPTGVITDFYNPGLDKGPGSGDRRHSFVASGSVLLPFDVNVGGVWTLRSTMPFSARAGIDLNADGAAGSDYVPGTTRNQGNRGDNAAFLAAVNTWRAQNGRAPISGSQLDTNGYNRFDVRATKAVQFGGRKVEFIAQVFNLFGRDNLGIAGTWQENALSNAFGTIREVQPRQQAELAVRFTF